MSRPDPSPPTAYPLAWPSARSRTPPAQRKHAAFRSGASLHTPATSKPVTLLDARERLSVEMDRLGARYPVLSTNLELRLDGQPRGGQAEPSDPGVALYFQLRDRPIVLACDRWLRVAANIAAIAAHIEALRGQERWGVGTLEQAFAGFVALPPPTDWRTLLGDPATLAEAEARYRELMRAAHPDAGGSHEAAAALNAAIEQARKILA